MNIYGWCQVVLVFIFTAAMLCIGAIDTFAQYESTTYTLTAGDANGDGSTNVGDAVYLINFIFKSGPPPASLNMMAYNDIYQRLDKIDSILHIMYRLSESGAMMNDGWPRLMINRSDYTIDTNGNIIFHKE